MTNKDFSAETLRYIELKKQNDAEVELSCGLAVLFGNWLLNEGYKMCYDNDASWWEDLTGIQYTTSKLFDKFFDNLEN